MTELSFSPKLISGVILWVILFFFFILNQMYFFFVNQILGCEILMVGSTGWIQETFRRCFSNEIILDPLLSKVRYVLTKAFNDLEPNNNNTNCRSWKEQTIRTSLIVLWIQTDQLFQQFSGCRFANVRVWKLFLSSVSVGWTKPAFAELSYILFEINVKYTRLHITQ